jgi:hypothetical protein
VVITITVVPFSSSKEQQPQQLFQKQPCMTQPENPGTVVPFPNCTIMPRLVSISIGASLVYPPMEMDGFGNVGKMINLHRMSILSRRPKFDTLPIPIMLIDSMLDFTNQRNGPKSLPTAEHNMPSLSVSITKDFVIGTPEM